MKNLKYLLVMLIALTTTMSCVEDDVFDDGSGPIVTADVKLNEIMSTGDPDWIEVYNAGNTDLDLSGYALKDIILRMILLMKLLHQIWLHKLV